MRAEIYWINRESPAKLAILLRPRGGDWLADEVRDWLGAGLDVVVSLLSEEEVAELDLAREAELCRSGGLEFISFPIIDRSVPASREETLGLARRLASRLSAGKNVGIHCRQGIGRSSLVAACALIQTGLSARTAFDLISQARGLTVPETAEQEKWVRDFAARQAASAA
jgi:protein-tyrosine phosphatase